MVLNATAVPLSPSEIHVYWQPPKRGKVTRYQLRYWRPGKRDKQSAWLIAPTTNYVAGELTWRALLKIGNGESASCIIVKMLLA